MPARALLLAPALGWAAAPLLPTSWPWLLPLALAALVLVALVPGVPARSAASVLVLLLAALVAVRTDAAGALWVTALSVLLTGWLVLAERWPQRREQRWELLAEVLLCAAGSALVAAVAVAGPRGGLPLAVLGLVGGAVAYRVAAGRPEG